MGFAALYISFMHLFTELYPDLVGGVLGQILSRGNLGVEIFLVISGIGLYYSLSKNFNLQKFYTKRIWRVVIPWLVVSGVYWLIIGALSRSFSFADFLLNWTGLSLWVNGTTTVWYVSFIVIMYAVYPVIYLVQRQRSEYLILLMAAVVVINCLLYRFAFTYYDMVEIALTRIPIFLFGSYLGEQLFNRVEDTKHLRTGYLSITILLFLLSLAIHGRDKNLSILFYRYGGAGIALVIMLVLCWIFFKLSLSPVRSVLRLYGEMSLEYFLIHVFLRNLTARSGICMEASAASQFLICVVILACATLLSFLYHKWMDRIRTKFMFDAG